jgi:hypothetical protein
MIRLKIFKNKKQISKLETKEVEPYKTQSNLRHSLNDSNSHTFIFSAFNINMRGSDVLP